MINTLYPGKYGAWAGNSHGHKPDFERCCVEVTRYVGNWPHSGQCTRKRGYGPDQAYCKIHDPEVVAARRKASDEAYRIKHNKERYQWHGATFYAALKQIAEGHNDARGLAQDVLKKFHDEEMK